MTTGSTETSLPGSLTQEGRQEDCNLFADIKAADWLGEWVGRHMNDVDLKQESSGSGLLDDIRAMDVVNMMLAEADEPLDRMADPISLKWVKSVGWVRSEIPVVVPGKTIRFAPPTEQPRTLSDRACLSVGLFAVSTKVYARWMRPQSRGPPVCKAHRSYRVTLKFLNYITRQLRTTRRAQGKLVQVGADLTPHGMLRSGRLSSVWRKGHHPQSTGTTCRRPGRTQPPTARSARRGALCRTSLSQATAAER